MNKGNFQVCVNVQCNPENIKESVALTVNGISVDIKGDSSPAKTPDSAQTKTLDSPSIVNHGWSIIRCDTKGYTLFIRLAYYAPTLLFITGILQFLAYHLYFSNIPDFISRYVWWIIYLDISTVALVSVLGYLRAYHLNTSHMLSMMIGMVVGMQAGTMLGAVVGATNGLFVGALVGMLSGGMFGIYIGCRCRSTMAVVQGLMSGGMAGTMGAMLIVMMLRDHVLYFMPFFTLTNILILLGFTYLFHEHAVASGECSLREQSHGFFPLLGLNLLTTGLLAGLMIFGPKGSMVWTGAPLPPMDMGQMQPQGMDMGGMDMGKMK